MKITLIHPSRGRATKAFETFRYWLKNMSDTGSIEVEHVLSIDVDDKDKETYYGLFKHTSIICNPNTSVVEATNMAALKSTGDVLIYLSDDFKCPKNWDLSIAKYFEQPMYRVLRVNDGHQPFENLVLTIPIMSRWMYSKLGYFFNPLYKSMWVDCDLYAETKQHITNAPELLFKHEIGPDDEIYNRSRSNFETGREIFNKRKQEFGWSKPFNKMPK